MIQTTLVFLRSNLSRDQFAGALEWVKAQERRLYLPDEKVWVLDLLTNPTDPAFEDALDDVKSAGWTIVGSTLWDASLPLRGHEAALKSLAELTGATRTNRNPK